MGDLYKMYPGDNDWPGSPPATARTSDGTVLTAGGEAVELTEAQVAELRKAKVNIRKQSADGSESDDSGDKSEQQAEQAANSGAQHESADVEGGAANSTADSSAESGTTTSSTTTSGSRRNR